MFKAQWKIPLETIHCVSRSSTRKTMILGKDYSDDPEIATLFGDAFGVGPARVDDASCTYIFFTGIWHRTRAVRLYGRPTVMLGSIGVCEWAADLCSQKEVDFFQELKPLELLKSSGFPTLPSRSKRSSALPLRLNPRLTQPLSNITSRHESS